MKTQLYVGAVVRRGDEVLLVRQSPGHSLAGQWTIPWGHVDAGESPMAAALREVLEEGGVEASVDGLVRRLFAGALTVTHSDVTNPLRAAGSFL